MRESGIYKIVNKATGEVYIGQSSNLTDRWKGHRSLLRNGRHKSHKLQAEWDRLGASAFKFEVIESLPGLEPFHEQLQAREKHHQNLHPRCLGRHDFTESRAFNVAQIRTMRARRAAGEQLQPIADDYGCTAKMVSYICRRDRYADVH